MKKFNFKQYLTILVSIILIVVNCGAFVVYRQTQRVDAARQWVAHSNQVIEQTFLLFYTLEETVTGQRGYLLTGQQEFLDTYRTSAAAIAPELERLEKLTTDNSVQADHLRLLDSLMHEELALLASHITMRDANPSGSLQTDEVMRAKDLIDRIRALKDTILSEEKQLLAERTAIQAHNETAFFNTLLITSGISIAILLFANSFILTMAGRKQAAERHLALAEQGLATVTDRLELALKGTHDGIFDRDIEHGTVFYSRRFKEMLGYSDAEFADSLEAFERLIHPDDVTGLHTAIDDYLQKRRPTYNHVYRMQHQNGSWRWHLARGIALFDPRGRATRLIGAHTDITEFKALEESLKASNKELEEFTYIASHDLRSPLVNLKGFASELALGVAALRPAAEAGLNTLDPQAKQLAGDAMEKDIPQALQFIHSSVLRMDKLTNAILELSRIGRRQLSFQPLNIRQIVNTVLATLAHQIAGNGISIEIGELPDVTADPVAIEQVFGNVIDNAIKYLDPARPGHIQISGSRTAAATTYCITDNGRGIAKADMKKIFEIFRRAGDTRHIPGEGMGMAYIKTMLRRHGGDIGCLSELGKGSTFYFTIAHHLTNEAGEAPHG